MKTGKKDKMLGAPARRNVPCEKRRGGARRFRRLRRRGTAERSFRCQRGIRRSS
jgi:hypothetical protein